MRSELSKAFENTVAECIIDTVPNMPDHIFSKEFEKKMKRLIRYGAPVPKRKITVKKLFIYITAAIIAASLAAVSVGAVGDLFKKFFMEVFKTHTDVRSAEHEEAPLEFLDTYEITADLADLESESYTELSSDIQLSYKNEHCRLYFTQSIKKYYDVAVNTEGYETENVYINEFEGLYVDMYNQNGKIVIWDNGDYIFTLLVSCDQGYDFSKDKLIDIAESVQKAE